MSDLPGGRHAIRGLGGLTPPSIQCSCTQCSPFLVLLTMKMSETLLVCSSWWVYFVVHSAHQSLRTLSLPKVFYAHVCRVTEFTWLHGRESIYTMSCMTVKGY